MSTSFVERFGHVQYGAVKRRPTHWRISVAVEIGCEFPRCRAGVELETIVFDHCHRHGVVRGTLCNGCNVRMGFLEAAMRLEGVTVDLGASAYAEWRARCPHCADVPPIPARGPFAALSFLAPRMPKPVLVVSGPPVSLPRLRVAHLPAGPKRTICGRIADAMVADAEGKALCDTCARRVEELS